MKFVLASITKKQNELTATVGRLLVVFFPTCVVPSATRNILYLLFTEHGFVSNRTMKDVC